MSKRSSYSLGADPELFLMDTTTTSIVPAYGRVGGTKDAPKRWPRAPKGFAYQEDGAAFEFNIPPAFTHVQFIDNIMWSLGQAGLLLAPRNLMLDPECRASYNFSRQQLEHPLAQVIGCNPDADGFTDGRMRDAWSAADFGTHRFCGGHLHFGIKDSWNIPPHVMAQLVAIWVHAPLMKLDPPTYRTQFYGMPGIFRPKPYGIEYRSMSPFWLKAADNYRALSIVSSLSFWLMNMLDTRLAEMADLYGQLRLDNYHPATLKMPDHDIVEQWRIRLHHYGEF